MPAEICLKRNIVLTHLNKKIRPKLYAQKGFEAPFLQRIYEYTIGFHISASSEQVAPLVQWRRREHCNFAYGFGKEQFRVLRFCLPKRERCACWRSSYCSAITCRTVWTKIAG